MNIECFFGYQKNDKVKNNSENIFAFGISLICAFVVMLICSQSSPLYLINEGCDPATLFTVGKCMKNGKALYRDVYEHKGLYYCFIHMFASYISENSYLGIFIIEVISFSVYLYFVYRIWRLYFKDFCIIFLPIWSMLVLTNFSFCQGDTVEEFCLPFFTISLYCLLKHMHNNSMNSSKIGMWILN